MTFLNWLASTLGTTAVLGFVIFVARTFIIEKISASIKYKYDIDLETHKANLKRDYDVQIEQLKAQLQIANVRFSHIYAKQAEAIAATYEKLLPLVDAVEDYTKLIQSSDENDINKRIGALNSASNTFFVFYRRVKIYIPKPTAKRLTDFVNVVLNIARKHSMLESMAMLRHHTTEEKLERFGKEIDEMKTRVTPLLAELENDFQTLLGVHAEEKQN